MKKIFSIVLILICLLGLVGCDPGTNYLPKDELLENTVKIELLHYENEDPELLSLNFGQKPTFDFNKTTLIATLDESDFEDFLDEVADREYMVFNTALNEPMGKTVVLYQSNGNIVVLFGCDYTDEKNKKFYGDCYIFDENGVYLEHIGDVKQQYIDMLDETYFSDTPQKNNLT